MKIKNSWNLGLLYKNNTDPQIEKDLVKIEVACGAFEKKYKNKSFTSTPEILAVAFEDCEKLTMDLNGHKPWWYFKLKTDLDSDDKKSAAILTKNEQRITDATNKTKFFSLEVAKIKVEDQKKFFAHPSLKPFDYALTRIFKRAKYNLSEGEEQLKDLISQTSHTMWVDATQRLMDQQTIKYKGKEIRTQEAITNLANYPKKDRKEINDKVNASLKSVGNMAEAELNAVYNFKKIMDKRRGFEKPYSATILAYENDEKAIISFVDLITKNFKIAHRFYALHAKLIGEKKISMGDRNAKIGEIKTKFDFQTSVEILRSVFEKIDKEYVAIFDKFLENGQIDVYPKGGKQGGAYCWGMGKLPTFVLLNHVNDARSLETLAHEMGHAIHGELSKKQPPRYQHYTISTAEVASTFFEQTIFEEIEKRLSEKEKIILLHGKVLGDIVTIFRQIACFNFELDLHEKIRTDGQVSKEGIASLMAKNLRAYLGKAVNVTDDDGYYYVTWSHIRRFFYVYSYAYGQIISRALYEQYKKDPTYATKIKQFLSAGSSMSPENIFKSIGIDTSKNSFFEAGLKGISADIAKLEKMARLEKTAK